MKVLIAGDFCPQNRVAKAYEEGKFSSLYQDLVKVTTGNDYSIVNLECPIVDDDCTPITKCGPHLKCNATAIEALRFCGFNACTLANNHFRDYGDKGCLNTMSLLKQSGIDYVGGGESIDEASKILYKSIDGKVLAIINCCENEFSIAGPLKAGSNPLNLPSQYKAIVAARKNSDYVIVIVHGGLEGCQLPSPRMQETYRFFIEVGADAVVNHHQHCYSGYELYLGRPIVYGLGNFSFDASWIASNYRTNWHEGYMVVLNFHDDGTISIRLIPYTQSFENPGTILMEGKDCDNFFRRIIEINRIIENPERLFVEYNKYIDTHSDWYRIIFEPWGKGFRSLRRKGWLPSLVSKQKWLSLADYMICETHHECIKRYFYKLIEQYEDENE